MRVASIMWCAMIPGLQVYLFRRIRDDLIKNHLEGPKGFRMLLAPWVSMGWVRILEGDTPEIRFWNGSKIFFAHCKDEKDRFKYLGAEIHVLLIDELTTFTEKIYRFLRGRVRAVGLNLPAKLKGLFPRILASSNPGNVGHLWVKAAFVDHGEFRVWQTPDSEGGMLRQFIPARLEDNPSMAEDDPLYEARLFGLGSSQLVKAMRKGDWNVVEGAYFTEWDTDLHVVRPFKVPTHWMKFRSEDWGSAKPFSVGWWTVASEMVRTPCGTVIPKGALVKYREWYGVEKDESGGFRPDVGLKLTAEQVGQGIVLRQDKTEKIAYHVADPSMWAEDGGKSLAERQFTKMREMGDKVPWRPADNARVPQSGHMGGWDQVRQRLIGEEGRPMLFVFSTCEHLIRTLPALQHDELRMEDVNSNSEDHAPDECFVAGTMVDTVDGPRPIESLTSGMVHSLGAPKRFFHGRMTKRDARVIKLTFSGMRSIICTPDHRFMTPDGWVRAWDMKGRDVCRSSLATQSRNSRVSGITAAGSISSGMGSGSTGLCGSARTGPYRPAGMFTTLITTAATIGWRTWSCCRRAIISATTALCGTAMWSAMVPVLPLPAGTAPMRAGSGTGSTTASTVQKHSEPVQSMSAHNVALPSWASRAQAGFARAVVSRHGAERLVWMMKTARAWFADLVSGSTGIASSGHAPGIAARCLAVEPAGRADVYCITVPETEAFSIEGGLLVHNCRYACMSRPYVTDSPARLEEMKGLDGLTMNRMWNEERVAAE